jgi:hypothetical protein
MKRPKPDLVSLHWFWSETDRRLDHLARQVKEGENVAEASNFCRWLKFSCAADILKPFESRMPLPIKAAQMKQKCNDLIEECNEWFALHERSNRPRDAYISKSKLDDIEKQMAAMMKKLEQAVGADPISLTIVKK